MAGVTQSWQWQRHRDLKLYLEEQTDAPSPWGSRRGTNLIVDGCNDASGHVILVLRGTDDVPGRKRRQRPLGAAIDRQPPNFACRRDSSLSQALSKLSLRRISDFELCTVEVAAIKIARRDERRPASPNAAAELSRGDGRPLGNRITNRDQNGTDRISSASPVEPLDAHQSLNFQLRKTVGAPNVKLVQ